jgi:predicted MPP superfamily phosphohydrolase
VRPALFFLFVTLIILSIDFYVWQGVKVLIQNSSPRTRNWVRWAYWGFTAFNFLLFFTFRFGMLQNFHRASLQLVFFLAFAVIVGKIIWTAFLLTDDLIRLIRLTLQQTGVVQAEAGTATNSVSRLKFLSQAGALLGAGLITAMTWGVAKGAHNYSIRRRSLRLQNLPEAFRGLKIVQISDVHSGSFWSYDAVKRGIDMILQERPDVIFFTGDLVNDRADEMEPWKELFGRLKAPMGVYSILGNHDYGDYVPWPSAEAKRANLEQLKKTHADMGWNLLLNEHRTLEKDGASIAILGVENWSNKARFPKYGKLQEALRGTEPYSVKLLLSHDPSHWKEQVLGKTDIQATFSGHTHGMQFGVDSRYYRWSPVKYVYKEWMDLYQEQGQYLYVNRGFGYLGYPGRVGILPEISVFTLETA